MTKPAASPLTMLSARASKRAASSCAALSQQLLAGDRRLAMTPRGTRRSYGLGAEARLRQVIALGWQAMPMLEQTGSALLSSRAQFTQPSLHRLQFGGPF